MKYTLKQIKQYINACNDFAKQHNSKFKLLVSSVYYENWSYLENKDTEDLDEQLNNKFLKFQNKWLKDNKMDEQVLALSIITSNKYVDNVDREST
jgi:hypothetical protein